MKWFYLGKWDRNLWNVQPDGGVTAKLTVEQLKQFAQFHYPVHAMGYNWLQSNALSVDRLEKRVDEIIRSWLDRKQ